MYLPQAHLASGICPSHLKEAVLHPSPDHTNQLLTTLTSFINLLAAGQAPHIVMRGATLLALQKENLCPISIIHNTSLDGEASEGLDGFPVLAVVYSTFGSPDFCDESGEENFEREYMAETASIHRSAMYPTFHLSMWHITSFKISLLRRQWPVARLASKHFAAMKILNQQGLFTGSQHTDYKQSLKTLAQ